MELSCQSSSTCIWEFQGRLKGVSRHFHSRYKEVSRVFKESVKCVLRNFKKKKVSRVFQECFNEVLFCNFVLALISSQLPEQKEGLFRSKKSSIQNLSLPKKKCQEYFKKVSRVFQLSFFMIFLLHGSHDSYPSRRRACLVLIDTTTLK